MRPDCPADVCGRGPLAKGPLAVHPAQRPSAGRTKRNSRRADPAASRTVAAFAFSEDPPDRRLLSNLLRLLLAVVGRTAVETVAAVVMTLAEAWTVETRQHRHPVL